MNCFTAAAAITALCLDTDCPGDTRKVWLVAACDMRDLLGCADGYELRAC